MIEKKEEYYNILKRIKGLKKKSEIMSYQTESAFKSERTSACAEF